MKINETKNIAREVSHNENLPRISVSSFNSLK